MYILPLTLLVILYMPKNFITLSIKSKYHYNPYTYIPFVNKYEDTSAF